MIGAAHTPFDAQGRLSDEATRRFVASLVAALRDWTLRVQTRA